MHMCTGFQDECIRKYDDLVFGMFAEVFRYLPLFSVVSEKIFIVHGQLVYGLAIRWFLLLCVLSSPPLCSFYISSVTYLSLSLYLFLFLSLC